VLIHHSKLLSAKGLTNLSRNVYENDFTFLVGDEHYRCPSFIAAFLSPRLAERQVSDPTLHDIVMETPDPSHYFQSFFQSWFWFLFESHD
jgi:hypothetical protein